MMSVQPISEPVPVTVIMLTLNEEFNLPGAIESVKDWAEEVFVVDSCSVDKTVDVALEHGVKIVQRPFTNYGDQWNWALEKVPIETPWVMKLDADERASSELKEEIRSVLSAEPDEVAFVIPVRLLFMGKRLHSKIHVCCLWRKEKGRFSGVVVNEHLLIDGVMGRLRCFIEHIDCANLHLWYEKQNRYTTMEAIMRFQGSDMATKPKLFGSSLERRMFLKRVFFKIPFRYQLQWLYEAIVRGALLDGSIGLGWIRLRIEVNRVIELKEKEMRATGKILEIPKPPKGDFDPRILSSPLQRLITKSETTGS